MLLSVLLLWVCVFCCSAVATKGILTVSHQQCDNHKDSRQFVRKPIYLPVFVHQVAIKISKNL